MGRRSLVFACALARLALKIYTIFQVIDEKWQAASCSASAERRVTQQQALAQCLCGYGVTPAAEAGGDAGFA